MTQNKLVIASACAIAAVACSAGGGNAGGGSGAGGAGPGGGSGGGAGPNGSGGSGGVLIDPGPIDTGSGGRIGADAACDEVVQQAEKLEGGKADIIFVIDNSGALTFFPALALGPLGEALS
jgi:hypothetical protein